MASEGVHKLSRFHVQHNNSVVKYIGKQLAIGREFQRTAKRDSNTDMSISIMMKSMLIGHRLLLSLVVTKVSYLYVASGLTPCLREY